MPWPLLRHTETFDVHTEVRREKGERNDNDSYDYDNNDSNDGEFILFIGAELKELKP